MIQHGILDLFPAHRVCWNFDPLLVALHTLSDALIAFAYFAIPAILFWLGRKYQVKRLSKVFFIYGLFILGCGLTHVYDVVTVWYANYWVYLADGIVRAATGVISIAAAIVTIKCTPFALAAFTKLAAFERRATERVVRLNSEPRYDTPEDREWKSHLEEIREIARIARETVRTGDS